MGAFRFNKNLPEQTEPIINSLESAFAELFEQLVLFKEELDRHYGLAAYELQKKLEDNIGFFSKSSAHLLYFADSVYSFVKMIQITDEGEGQVNQMRSRDELKYAFSSERVEGTITLDPASLNEATSSFENNIKALEEILNKFNTLLDNLIFGTEFPWGDLNQVWPDAKSKIKFTLDEAQKRLEGLVEDSNGLVKELERVDNLIHRKILDI